MTTELVLLGTAGAPMPVAGRGGISSALIVNPWDTRVGDNGPLAPIRVYGPARPEALPAGDGDFCRETTIHPELPAPGTTDLVDDIRFSGKTTAGSDGLRRALPRIREGGIEVT